MTYNPQAGHVGKGFQYLYEEAPGILFFDALSNTLVAKKEIRI